MPFRLINPTSSPTIYPSPRTTIYRHTNLGVFLPTPDYIAEISVLTDHDANAQSLSSHTTHNGMSGINADYDVASDLTTVVSAELQDFLNQNHDIFAYNNFERFSA